MDLSFDEGIQTRESIVTLKKGSTRVYLTVSNTTGRNIKIPGKTYLEDLHLIHSMTPVEVSFKEFDNSKTVVSPSIPEAVGGTVDPRQSELTKPALARAEAAKLGLVGRLKREIPCVTEGAGKLQVTDCPVIQNSSHIGKFCSYHFDSSDAGHFGDAGRAIQSGDCYRGAPDVVSVCSCSAEAGVSPTKCRKDFCKNCLCQANGLVSDAGVEDVDTRFFSDPEVPVVLDVENLADVDTRGVPEDFPCVDTEDERAFNKRLQELDLSNLTLEQQEIVKSMLLEERLSFAQSDDDIGDAKDLQLEIKTVDEVPVVKSYNSIPRPLFNEVKGHVQDLVNRGWVTKSKSSWSSPVVVVRKKSREISLCCNFRQ